MRLALVASNPNVPPASACDRALRRLRFKEAQVLREAAETSDVDQMLRYIDLGQKIGAAIDVLSRWGGHAE